MGNDFKDLFGDWHPDDDEGRSAEEMAPASEARPSRQLNEREVRVINVFEATGETLAGTAQTHIFILLRDNKHREIKIFVGREVALAISMALEQHTPDRPFTHDLLKSVLDKFGARIDHVIIDDLLQDTFYAKIVLTHHETVREVDARPSDAIAMALRFRAPIYVAESVLESASES